MDGFAFELIALIGVLHQLPIHCGLSYVAVGISSFSPIGAEFDALEQAI